MALNASVSQVGEQMGCLFRLSRVASSEMEFPPEPRPCGRLGRGVSNEAELACFSRVGFPPSSEAKMWCAARVLGGEALSEAEIVLRVRGGLRRVVL